MANVSGAEFASPLQGLSSEKGTDMGEDFFDYLASATARQFGLIAGVFAVSIVMLYELVLLVIQF
jgi:hypothetical protein